MSIFAQVSSTPESVYEEIMNESGQVLNKKYEEWSDDWYIHIFFRSLKYAIDGIPKSSKVSAEQLIAYTIGTWVYNERDKNCIRFQGKFFGHRSVYQFYSDFKERLHYYLDIPFYPYDRYICNGYPYENEEETKHRDSLYEAIIRAYYKRYGKDYDYDKVIKDYRVQEALKFYV